MAPILFCLVPGCRDLAEGDPVPGLNSRYAHCLSHNFLGPYLVGRQGGDCESKASDGNASDQFQHIVAIE